MIGGNALQICDWWLVNENIYRNALLLLLMAKNRSNRHHLVVLILGGD